MHEDDEANRLLAAASGGDRHALGRLLELHLPRLHAYVRVRLGDELGARADSLDVVQSVCRQLLASPAALPSGGDSRFRAWLFTAALNKVREKVRQHRADRRDLRRERPLDADPVTAAAILASPSQEAIGNETAQAVAAAMEALGEDHREVVSLARIARLPHAVIGEVMGRSEDAVRKLLGRALLALAAELRRRGITVDGQR